MKLILLILFIILLLIICYKYNIQEEHINIPNNSIIYVYNIGEGGLADIIKYLFQYYYISLLLKKELYIIFNHPSKYLFNFKKIKILKDSIDLHKIKKLSDYSGNAIDILKSHNIIQVKNMDFYNKKLLWNDLPNIKIICQYFGKISNVIDFTDYIYKKLKLILPKDNYISIHCRLGDKYLNDKELNIQNKKFINILNNISKIIEQHKYTDIYIFSDNKHFKKIVTDKFYNIKSLNNNIIHFGLKNHKISNTEYINGIENTILEFLFLSYSYKIYRLLPSGYSEVASFFNNIAKLSSP
jgi:hypothetical protein